ncbi:MAG: hypothetical protein PHO20_03985 [Candidatus Peribacteraceae bacterium]|jgi:hypothetical protein|nr:hypothetical protein [Candidatus Peribacteraceae bacterium]MDD5739901.1 hypothetical protein [Candidatus Peribacteraceae bacterium]
MSALAACFLALAAAWFFAYLLVRLNKSSWRFDRRVTGGGALICLTLAAITYIIGLFGG